MLSLLKPETESEVEVLETELDLGRGAVGAISLMWTVVPLEEEDDLEGFEPVCERREVDLSLLLRSRVEFELALVLGSGLRLLLPLELLLPDVEGLVATERRWRWRAE